MNQLGLKCSVLISDFRHWQNRYLYIELMENFLNDIIDVQEFDTKFLSMWSLNRDKEKSWEEFIYIVNNFKLSQFQDFSCLTSKLFTDLDVFEPDPLLREDYEIDEDELKNYVKKTLLKIKNNYC